MKKITKKVLEMTLGAVSGIALLSSLAFVMIYVLETIYDNNKEMAVVLFILISCVYAAFLVNKASLLLTGNSLPCSIYLSQIEMMISIMLLCLLVFGPLKLNYEVTLYAAFIIRIAEAVVTIKNTKLVFIKM